MPGNILWKLILSVAIVGWALSNLIPLTDTPYPEYLSERVAFADETAEADFEHILQYARERVERAGEILLKEDYSEEDYRWALQDIHLVRELEAQEKTRDEIIKGVARANRSLYQALLTLGEDPEGRLTVGLDPRTITRGEEQVEQYEIDFARFFAGIDTGTRNITKRNELLLRYLNRQAQGAYKPGLDLAGGIAFTLKLDAAEELDARQKENSLKKAVDIMTRRVDALGVAEPVVRPVGDDAIEIQLPGETDADPDDLSAPARLSFHKVYRWARPSGPNPLPTEIPPGYTPMSVERTRDNGEVERIYFYVKEDPEATGEIVEQATPRGDGYGGYLVSFDLREPPEESDSKSFEQISREVLEANERYQREAQQTNRTLAFPQGLVAIVLDGELYSAPRIRAVISDSGQIDGDFTQQEVTELANVLNNPLDKKLRVDEIYRVSPTLAEGARESSLQAGMWGMILVVGFMVALYLFSGIVAVVSVLLALGMVAGILASIGATFTLPAIAALVLTLGMAVDAQILIFERIREETRAGKDARNALQAGYDKAFSTIVDANVTTLITAIILYALGTGPVKGFGVTLAVGIGSSMFAALVITRMMLEAIVAGNLLGKLIPYKFVFVPNKPFLKYSRLGASAALLLILVGWIAVFTRGSDDILGIDFRGGSKIQATFQERIPVDQIDAISREIGLGGAQAQYQSLVGTNQEVLALQTESGLALPEGDGFVRYDADAPEVAENPEAVTVGRALVAELNERFPARGAEGPNLAVQDETFIGPSVSETITTNAIASVIIALLLMLLYVALRFDFGFGIGAVVATIHDVLMTIGIFVLFGNEFSAPMVAAILMVVGYSINDTIVVFDRIREELELNPEMGLAEVVNLSIGRTLSRTLLTSVTTLLATLTLLIFGAGVIQDYAFVFLVGILTGTFSSIFVATPIFYWRHKGDRGLVNRQEDRPQYEWETGTRAAREQSATGPA